MLTSCTAGPRAGWRAAECIDSETEFRLDAQEKIIARCQAGEAGKNCDGKGRERKEGCAKEIAGRGGRWRKTGRIC